MGLIDASIIDGLHYSTQYTCWGEDAVLTIACGEPPVTLTVIDKVDGFVVLDGPAIDTTLPMVKVQSSALAEKSVSVSQLADATLSFKGAEFRITSHRYGLGKYEIALILEEVIDG